jgi:hypothetical protein
MAMVDDTYQQPTADEAPRNRVEAGEWSGEYLDATGQRANLVLRFDRTEGDVEGSFELTFKTEDEPFVVSGPIRGKGEVDRLTFEMPIREEGRDESRMLRYEARVGDAGSYARQALFGIADEVPQAGFAGGVWIAWRFDREGEKAG